MASLKISKKDIKPLIDELLTEFLEKRREDERAENEQARKQRAAEREQRRKEKEAQKEQARAKRAASLEAAREQREKARLKYEAERAAARQERRRKQREEAEAYRAERAAERAAARQQRAAALEAEKEERRKKKELRQQQIAAEKAARAAARKAKKKQTEQERREKKRALIEADISRCKAGLMNTAMLYGAVYVLRSQLKLAQYESMQNFARALREAGFSPVERTQNTCWWEAAPILQKLCTSYRKNNAVREFIAADFITPNEIITGEWQPINICHIKTGLPKYIISGYASKGTIPFRINPDDNTRLFHLPSLYERSCWIEETALKRRHGMETFKQLISCRKTKQFGVRMWVYAPELTILPQTDDE